MLVRLNLHENTKLNALPQGRENLSVEHIEAVRENSDLLSTERYEAEDTLTRVTEQCELW